MEQQKKEWTELTLDALNGMQRAPMPAALSGRILSSIPAKDRKIITLRQSTVMLAAAGLALLIGFNIYSLNAHNARQATHSVVAMHGDNPVADDYFLSVPSI